MNDEFKDAWNLRNIEDTPKEWNETFRLPSRQDRENQGLGDLVQLHFIPVGQDSQVERMWVEIVDAQEGRYTGELLNAPNFIDGITIGTLIHFRPEHIGRILVRPGNPLWCDCYEKRVIVSARVLEPGRGACFAYRETPSHEDDSGWRLTEGTEDEAYMDDVNNAHLVVAGVLIEQDASLAAVFRGEFGDDCQRTGLNETWFALDQP